MLYVLVFEESKPGELMILRPFSLAFSCLAGLLVYMTQFVLYGRSLKAFFKLLTGYQIAGRTVGKGG